MTVLRRARAPQQKAPMVRKNVLSRRPRTDGRQNPRGAVQPAQQALTHEPDAMTTELLKDIGIDASAFGVWDVKKDSAARGFQTADSTGAEVDTSRPQRYKTRVTVDRRFLSKDE